MPSPLEIPFEKVLANIDKAVDAVFSCLQSEFMVLPKGKGFVEFPIFEKGYKALRKSTGGFGNVSPDTVMPVVLELPISLIVLRTMLGFYTAGMGLCRHPENGPTGSDQGFARTLDRNPAGPSEGLEMRGSQAKEIECPYRNGLLAPPRKPPSVQKERIHGAARNRYFWRSREFYQRVAGAGVPYSMLLMRGFSGRPFAGHRDSVSESVGMS